MILKSKPKICALANVPDDIIREIVDIVAVEERSSSGEAPSAKEDLKNLCLTSSRFLPHCQSHLFKSVACKVIVKSKGALHHNLSNSKISLPNILKKSPYIAEYIRSLTLTPNTSVPPDGDKFTERSIKELDECLSKIRNLRQLKVDQLTGNDIPSRPDLTNALRKFVLSNPEITDLHIQDTIYFPMDVLSRIPGLVNLTVQEVRFLTETSHYHHRTKRSLFSDKYIEEHKPGKYLHLPEVVDIPTEVHQSSLRCLELYGSMITLWTVKHQLFNFSALTELMISLHTIEDFEAGLSMILKYAKTLGLLRVVLRHIEPSYLSKSFNLSGMKKLQGVSIIAEVDDTQETPAISLEEWNEWFNEKITSGGCRFEAQMTLLRTVPGGLLGHRLKTEQICYYKPTENRV